MLIQTVRDDVVFSGHGSTLPAAGKVTRVPAGVEFYLLAPPGAGITNRLGQALERGERITELYIRSSVTKQFSPHRHAVYTSATGDIPNMALHPPRGLDISSNMVPHVIGVDAILTCMIYGRARDRSLTPGEPRGSSGRRVRRSRLAAIRVWICKPTERVIKQAKGVARDKAPAASTCPRPAD